MKTYPITEQWRELVRLRNAVREAATLPDRIAALCEYQGRLAKFFDAHGVFIEHAIADSISRYSPRRPELPYTQG